MHKQVKRFTEGKSVKKVVYEESVGEFGTRIRVPNPLCKNPKGHEDWLPAFPWIVLALPLRARTRESHLSSDEGACCPD